jgi:hypothetical protein
VNRQARSVCTAWSGNTLAFIVTAAGTLASLMVGGNPVAFTTETIKGITHAIFPASSGSCVATYAP